MIPTILVRLIFEEIDFSKEVRPCKDLLAFSLNYCNCSRVIEFGQAVKKHCSDYSAKGLSSWGQFVAMLITIAEDMPKRNTEIHCANPAPAI
jgi:hypothetical protein